MTLIEVINASLDELRGSNDAAEMQAVVLHHNLNSPAVLAALEALPPAAQDAIKEAWEICSAF